MQHLIDDLRRTVAEGSGVLLVGAGVSIASTNDPVASWPGLLRDGIRRASTINRTLPANWSQLNEDQLDMALESGHVDSLLATAEAVDSALRPVPGEYANWLLTTVGHLEAHNTKLLHAIASLQLPILTTNYDTLIEVYTGYEALDHSNEAAIHRVLRGDDTGIVHLHGHWRRPGDVILGVRSYDRLLAATKIHELLKAVFFQRSVILVGVGAGLDDPNFSALRIWLNANTAESPYRHYLLCTERDAEDLSIGSDRIAPLVYGRAFENLTGFLNGLAESVPPARQRVYSPAERARLRLTDQIHESSFLRRVTEGAEPQLEDLLIPPVLLPMPHEKYVAGLRGHTQSRPRRIDAAEYDGHPKVVIVVAPDSGSGLTSSLAWLLANTRVGREATPVYLRSSQLTQGKHPLLQPVRAFLREVGHDCIRMNYDNMPPTAVAIDDYSIPRDNTITGRLISDLRQVAIRAAFFGCREGREAELHRQLSSHGIDALVWYVGRFSDRDLERLVALVSENPQSVARHLSDILVREQLPRKPITVCILLLAVLQHAQLADSISETDLLDSFALILLGRDSPFQDSRYDLGYRDKEDLLAYLAERYVRENKWSLPDRDIIAYLDDYLSAMRWREDALGIIQDFLTRRILVVTQGSIAFHDTPFLYLFAAKRAQRDQEFLAWLKEGPFVYGPILRHYAALARSDSHLLSVVSDALGEVLASRPETRYFEPNPLDDGAEAAEAELLDIRAAFLGINDGEDGDEDASVAFVDPGDVEPGPQGGDSDSREADDDLPLGYLEFVRSEPAPFNADAATGASWLFDRVHFVSQVVRDSVSVSNPDLKLQSLVQVLRGWGEVAAEVAGSAAFRELAECVAAEMAAIEVSPGVRSLLSDIGVAFPIWLIMAGMEASLASTKVLSLVEDVFRQSRGDGDARCAAVAGLFVLLIRDPGWAQIAAQTYQDFRAVKPMERALFPVLTFLYLFGGTGAETQALEDTILDSVGYRRTGRRANEREQARQRLQRARLVNRAAIGQAKTF